jgi:hypothetical protein
MVVVVVGSTPNATLVVVEVLMLVIEDDRASVDIRVLFEGTVVVEEVEIDEVRVGRQEQADEIRDGSPETPEQCETNEGRPIVAVFSIVV